MSPKGEPKPWAAYGVILILCGGGIAGVAVGMHDPKPPPPAVAEATPSSSAVQPAYDGKLEIQDIKVGTGDTAQSGDTLTVQYAGTLMNGTEFDNSRKHGTKGFSFKLGTGNVIKGWDEGMVGMKVGGTRKLTIPASLAYGHRGAGAQIPPDSMLVFVVDLESVTKP